MACSAADLVTSLKLPVPLKPGKPSAFTLDSWCKSLADFMKSAQRSYRIAHNCAQYIYPKEQSFVFFMWGQLKPLQAPVQCNIITLDTLPLLYHNSLKHLTLFDFYGCLMSGVLTLSLALLKLKVVCSVFSLAEARLWRKRSWQRVLNIVIWQDVKQHRGVATVIHVIPEKLDLPRIFHSMLKNSNFNTDAQVQHCPSARIGHVFRVCPLTNRREIIYKLLRWNSLKLTEVASVICKWSAEQWHSWHSLSLLHAVAVL